MVYFENPFHICQLCITCRVCHKTFSLVFFNFFQFITLTASFRLDFPLQIFQKLSHMINQKKIYYYVFTNAIQAEGRVDAIWDAIPGISNKSGKARVHFLPVFIVSVHR